MLRQILLRRGWLHVEEQRDIYGQHLVNVIRAVSWLGSVRVNRNAEFCIFALNKKMSLHHPTKALDISKNTYNYTSCTKMPNFNPQIK